MYVVQPGIAAEVRKTLVDSDDGSIRDLIAARARISKWSQLAKLSAFGREILSECLHDGRLDVVRVSGKSLSSSMKTHMMRNERVHGVASEEELLRRLRGNRTAFALHHPITGNVPLAMVYVALTSTFPASIDEILAGACDELRERPQYAVFYSISMGYPGAGGLGLGRVLITEALAQLRHKYPSVEKFQTLSPIRVFRPWLDATHPGAPAEDRPFWCREYLQQVYRGVVRPIDAVAVFHYGNGAILDRVVPHADPQSMDASYGLMASYKYESDRLEERRRQYRENKRPAPA